MQGHIQSGVIRGAAAAVNVLTGFVPALVLLNNSRGATERITVWSGNPVVSFDSGSVEVQKGDILVDETAGGKFRVVSVTILSGSIAGGDAAGFFEIKELSGTVTNNNTLGVVAQDTRAARTDVATVDGSVVTFDTDIDSEVGTPASRFVTAYEGNLASNAKGFTIAAGALPDGEFVRWVAISEEL